ncbi:hypothetical protein [Nocardia terpenica]|uniref:Uncharacterized protein n=1 Tax=Nocardia terpenica TaxID=455432 RepID=A0A291RG88_9NOCA|nr:hypothetical protein [Nocardia terpenica]ATL66377.1 hypothetical protein CRH09_09335 [Nocardia terpenica]
MRAGRWVILPSALTCAMVVLIALRIRIVRQRTGDWSGENCVIGPYNPAERSYLYAITAVFALTVATAVAVTITTNSRRARIVAIGLLVFCGLATLYIFAYVWAGLEYNNRPDPSMPCPFRRKDLHL